MDEFCHQSSVKHPEAKGYLQMQLWASIVQSFELSCLVTHHNTWLFHC